MLTHVRDWHRPNVTYRVEIDSLGGWELTWLLHGVKKGLATTECPY